MNDFTQTLRDLLAARGPSGYETAPASVWSAAAQAFGARVQTDLVGTPSACVPASDEGSVRRLVVMGHIDEIGLIVTHIDDEGYLWFREVGGWDAQILVGQRVVLATRDDLRTINNYLKFSRYGDSLMPIGLPLSQHGKEMFSRWSDR